MASQHIQHMQKALTQMNVQIHHVISDITGVTGLAIVDAILGGQRDPLEWAKLRDPHIKASAETIRKSLKGKMYRNYPEQIAACDEEIERLLLQFPALGRPGRKAAGAGPEAKTARP
jgi:hypothetical protein